ncbi:MAG: GntR family transcriptional regulator [Solibacillus sp.]
MNVNANSTTPIYIQIAEWLENEILADRLEAHGKVYSQYQLAELFNINPATAGKGLTILADNEILYKKRGLGMFVMDNAKSKILATRRDETLLKMARDLVIEAKRLAVNDEELLTIIQRVQKEAGQ